jgi:glycosyltransferase involved in cell wall biosynthesis
MKMALLSAASSIHTIRWANGLAEAGWEVHVISQHPQLESMEPRVKVHILPFHGVLGYFTMVPAVKKILKRIKPDIVNAHYASGYGTTARLVGYHPWVLSVWGSDIYDFPYKSPLHKRLVRKNLLAADGVASTSVCMAEQTRSIAPKLSYIAITPFGVDTVYYDPLTTSLANRDANLPITIGTVKTLAPLYGIDILIKAFEILLKNLSQTHPEIEKSLRLRLVGTGHQELELKALTQQLGISKRTDFVGRVDSSQVPVELEKLDIYVALSRQESFGVAIIEAGAAGRPVVVSNAGGLPEVVLDGRTGIVVPKGNPQAAADAISKLVLDRDLRIQMGEAGKQHVVDTYDWSACINTMTNLYEKIINQYKSKV